MIYFISDTHFCHDRDFCYKRRGFDSVDAMNEKLLENWNKTVLPEDDVFHLGDVMLNDSEKGIEIVKQLHGKIHLIRGNHDTNEKVRLLENCPNIVDVKFADILNYGGYHFYMSHYPAFCAHIDNRPLKADLINLFAHTHQASNFYSYPGSDVVNPKMYHVGVDSHGYRPVSVETIISDINAEYTKQCATIWEEKDNETPEERATRLEKQKKAYHDALDFASKLIEYPDVAKEIKILQAEGEIPWNLSIQDTQGLIKRISPQIIWSHPAELSDSVHQKAAHEIIVGHIKDYIKEVQNI